MRSQVQASEFVMSYKLQFGISACTRRLVFTFEEPRDTLKFSIHTKTERKMHPAV